MAARRSRSKRSARRRSALEAIAVGAASSAGPRPDNQDRFLARAGLGILSDGVGGYAGGSRAAELSVAATRSVLEVARSCGQEVDANVLGEAFARANLDVRRARARDPQHCHMGATLTVAIRSADAGAASRWRIAHSGDSPVFRVTPAGATAVTADHTVPGLLLAQRSITSAEAADHP